MNSIKLIKGCLSILGMAFFVHLYLLADTVEESRQAKDAQQKFLASALGSYTQQKQQPQLQPPGYLSTSSLAYGDWVGFNNFWVQDVSLSPTDGDPYFIQNCSELPFQHCCVGQNRQSDKQIVKKQALWRLVGAHGKYNLNSLSNVLHYLASNITKDDPANSMCSIVFSGDSLSSDHAMAANCQLLSYGYELTSCNTLNIGGPAYGRDTNMKCKANLYGDATHFLLENSMAKSCRKVLIGYAPNAPNTNSGDINMKLLQETSGVVVFNWGVHCNTPLEGCVSKKLKHFLSPFFSGKNSTGFKQWRFLFRETEPQHFAGTIDGTYGGRKDNVSGCGPIQKVNDWRNKEAASFLLEHNLTDIIKTISIHDDLVPLWQLHHDPDCTHYAYNPYRFDLTWDRMLKALSS